MRVGNAIIALVLGMLLSQLSSCNKPDTIGSDLIDNDNLDVIQIDTAAFSFFAVKTDSVTVYKEFRNNLNGHFLCGELDDPIFGFSTSDIYSQMRVNFNSSLDLSMASGFNVDSAYFVMYYDLPGFYGDSSQEVTVQIRELTDDLDTAQTYYSNQSFAVGNEVIAQRIFLPKAQDSFNIFTNLPDGSLDTGVIRGAVKIPLLNSLFNKKLLLDSNVLKRPVDFLNIVKGIKISAETNKKRYVSFNLPASYLRVYYSSSDTTQIMNFYFNTTIFDKVVNTVNFNRNFQNAPIEQYLQTGKDSVGFVRGMNGLQTRVELEKMSILEGNVIIGHAELIFNVKVLEGDNLDLYPPIDILLAASKDNNELFFLLEDAQKAWDNYILRPNKENLKKNFGGVATKRDNGTWEYRMNITSYYQDFIQDKELGIFYISLPTGQSTPARVAIGGPDCKQNPAKLKITYTKY